MKLEYNYEHYKVSLIQGFGEWELCIEHKVTGRQRFYSVVGIEKVTCESQELTVFQDKTHISFRFDSEDYIVADVFEEHTNEFVDTFASFNFLEDWHE